MRSRRVQVGAPIGRCSLLDLAKSHCADEHPIALEQCEIGGDHELRLAQYLSNAWRGLWFARTRSPVTLIDFLIDCAAG